MSAAKFKGIAVFKPPAKPREAFAGRSWANPMEEGPLGRIRWAGWNERTVAVHAGGNKESDGKFVIAPVVTSTTMPTITCDELAARFENGVVEGRTGGIYERLGSKPAFELECALTGMHGCGDSIVFGSGMAAISHTILPLVTAGDNVVVHKTVYGCTDELFREQLPALGIETRFIDMRNLKMLDQAIDARTRAVFFETPSNPVLDVIEIAKVVDVVNGRCPVIVDNTFASPRGQNPFEKGAHVVVYSMTKSIGGHSNAIGGAVLGGGRFIEHLFSIRKDLGGILPAREASAFLDGIKTLPLRYEKMQANAIEIARELEAHGEVQRVHYPSLDPGYPFDGQMKGPGYMVAFILKKGLEGGKVLIDNLKVITHAVSLGSVESLMCHPASTTHASVPKAEREGKGISDGLLRISVGTESLGDILDDLMQALRKVAEL
ncbi:methionine gamma-lyase [Candidatus Micrarchaeota archaeon]|nr:MAG: methionine gamma-lyase [Candidatus Micrarchaeota archaeon]